MNICEEFLHASDCICSYRNWQCLERVDVAAENSILRAEGQRAESEKSDMSTIASVPSKYLSYMRRSVYFTRLGALRASSNCTVIKNICVEEDQNKSQLRFH